MNWIIIANTKEDENLIQIQHFLENKHKITPYEIFLTADLTNDELFDALRHVIQATHCIIVDSKKMNKLRDYCYLMGALASKNIKTFIYTGEPYAKRYEVIANGSDSVVSCFKNVTDLMRRINNDFVGFNRIDNQKQALIQLFTLGIPFTSDCFAQYIAKDDDEICGLFYDAGMLINARTSEGTPLISIATRNDCLNKVKWLCENGAEVNTISSDRGYSPVMDAVWRKNYEITEYLIERGADLKLISTDGQPILVLAVGNGDYNIVELLLKNGADPQLQDGMGMSARAYAALFKRTDLVELIDSYACAEPKQA